jgi:sucrose synthase
VHRFVATLKAEGKSLYLGHEIAARLRKFLAHEPCESPQAPREVEKTLRGCSEIILDGDAAYAMLRPGIGRKRLVRFHPSAEHLEDVSRGDYLQLKDGLVQGRGEAARLGLVIDFSPFFRHLPRVGEASDMGHGVSFLNRRLAAQISEHPERFGQALLDFLSDQRMAGAKLLVNDHLRTDDDLRRELDAVRGLLEDCEPNCPYAELAHELRVHGFEAGWGADAQSIATTLSLLAQTLDSAEPARFEQLLARLPLVRTVVMASPHGWFAQEGVLGRPDTGGQVTYVLDQARALERELNARLAGSGVAAAAKVIVLTRLIPHADGTTCDVPREKIFGTEDSWIIRVPFRDAQGDVVPDWISRFQLWPYLEGFAEEAKATVVNELLGKPDLIVGHYTDGNLAAHLLAEQLGATHAACVHALEKTKYLLSDAHWEAMEAQYRFSVHFTADLIAYNSADFIITSSSREIGGTPDEPGMIESYELFSLPGLYRVQSGFDPRLSRHNIVPPGASEDFFFCASAERPGHEAVAKRLRERFLQQEPVDGAIGWLENSELPPIFAMARMDRIKNLSGLAEIFGRHERLRSQANLLLVTSVNRLEDASDPEEAEEVRRTQQFIDQYALDGHVRWCAARLDKVETGEIYRLTAAARGVFAQPAFMETFGLTVIEAMACGLPVVATCFGGPAEIIENGVCGLTCDPNDQDAYAEALLSVVADAGLWDRFHAAGIARVENCYRWNRHARRLIDLANVYRYWNHTDVMNRPALERYLHTLYHTVYRTRTRTILEGA